MNGERHERNVARGHWIALTGVAGTSALFLTILNTGIDGASLRVDALRISVILSALALPCFAVNVLAARLGIDGVFSSTSFALMPWVVFLLAIVAGFLYLNVIAAVVFGLTTLVLGVLLAFYGSRQITSGPAP
jgi:hypothetical protein